MICVAGESGERGEVKRKRTRDVLDGLTKDR